MSIERIDPGRRFAQAVVYGDTVYLAGHTSTNADAGVYEQTREILAAIDAHLAAAGSDRSKLLSASIWLTDIATFDEMNRAWDAWVDPANLPARATVEAKPRLAGLQGRDRGHRRSRRMTRFVVDAGVVDPPRERRDRGRRRARAARPDAAAFAGALDAARGRRTRARSRPASRASASPESAG